MFSYFQCASVEKRREKRTVSVYFGNELWMTYQVFMYQLCFNFSLALITVINGPANRLLSQIGAKEGAAETSACFPDEIRSNGNRVMETACFDANMQ